MLLPGCCNRHGSPSEKSRPERSWDITCTSRTPAYIFLIEGEIKVDGTVLSRRDGMGVYETDSFELETLQDSHILLIEVPM